MTPRWNIGFLSPVALFTLASCAVTTEDVKQPPASAKPSPPAPSAEVSSVSLEDFFQLHESGKAVVIDARPSFVYQFGHIPGAINLPKSHCAQSTAKHEAKLRSSVAAGKTVIVYCTGLNCPDARTVAAYLNGSGIPASLFPGGWEAWRQAGMPVE